MSGGSIWTRIGALAIVFATSCAAQSPYTYFSYVVNSPVGGVTIVRHTTSGVQSVHAVSGLSGTATRLVIDPSGIRAYVVTRSPDTVAVIDGQTDTVAYTIALPKSPVDVAVAQDGTRLYIPTTAGTVLVVDPNSKTLVNTISAQNDQPLTRITLNRLGTMAYVLGAGGVSRINLKTNVVERTVPATGSTAIALSQGDEQMLYVAGDGLTLLAADSLNQIRKITTPYRLTSIGTVHGPPMNGQVYITGEGTAEAARMTLPTDGTAPTITSLGGSNSASGIEVFATGTFQLIFLTQLTSDMFAHFSEFSVFGSHLEYSKVLSGGQPNQIASMAVQTEANCFSDQPNTPRRLSFPRTASKQSYFFYAFPDCSWRATSSASWLRIVAGDASTGYGLIEFMADDNPQPTTRSAYLTVAQDRGGGSRYVLVTQAGSSCKFAISPAARVVASGQHEGDIEFTATSGCTPTVNANVPWIKVGFVSTPTDIERDSSGYISYTVQPNSVAVSRSGVITIGDQAFQVTQLPSGALQCTPSGELAKLRSESIAELAGDVVLTCNGNVPPGQEVLANVFVTLNTAVTNRVDSAGSQVDALLLLNVPSSGTPALVAGQNAFRGKVAGNNTLRFDAVPITRFGDRGYSTLRITNIRVDAKFSQSLINLWYLSATIDIFASLPIAVTAPSTFPQNTSRTLFRDRTYIGAGPYSLSTYSLTPVALSGGGFRVPVRFAGSADLFRKRGNSSQSAVIGSARETETGFTDPVLGSTTGAADSGTRLHVRVPVATGVRVFASVRPNSGSGAQLVLADFNGAGGIPTVGSSAFGGTYQELSPVAGVVAATWEVVEPPSSGEYVFDLILQNADTPTVTAAVKGMVASLGPISTVVRADKAAPIPRFFDPNGLLKKSDLRVVLLSSSVSTKSNSNKQARADSHHDAVASNYITSYAVLNDSSEPATDVTVRDFVSGGLIQGGCARSDGGGCIASGSDIVATIPRLNAGEQITITATSTDSSDDLSLRRSRRISVASQESDYDLTSNEISTALSNLACSGGSNTSVGLGFSSAGGSGQFNITPDCGSWSVSVDAAWVRVDSSLSGTGPTEIRYSVLGNNTAVSRKAIISVGGQRHTVVQAGTSNACGFAVMTTSSTASANGEPLSVSVIATGAQCAWIARSTHAWAEIYPLGGTGSATLKLTIYPNFGTQVRSATITAASEALPVVQSGMTGSPDLRFARRTYFNVLRRLPSQAEEQFRVNQLASGMDRATLMQHFLESAEFRNNGSFVSALYRSLLSRVPEFTGWAFQTNAMVNSSISQIDLARNFLSSAEWRLKQAQINPAGVVTDAEFVGLLYREVIGREGSTPEVSWQICAFVGCPVGTPQTAMTIQQRAQMTVNFLGAPELYLRRGPLFNALHAYIVILGRDPSVSELSWLEAILQTGTPFANIVQSFVNSAEHNSALQ